MVLCFLVTFVLISIPSCVLSVYCVLPHLSLCSGCLVYVCLPPVCAVQCAAHQPEHSHLLLHLTCSSSCSLVSVYIVCVFPLVFVSLLFALSVIPLLKFPLVSPVWDFDCFDAFLIWTLLLVVLCFSLSYNFVLRLGATWVFGPWSHFHLWSFVFVLHSALISIKLAFCFPIPCLLSLHLGPPLVFMLKVWQIFFFLSLHQKCVELHFQWGWVEVVLQLSYSQGSLYLTAIKCGQCLNSMLSEDGINVLVAVEIFPKDIVDICVVCCNVCEHALCRELSWCVIIFNNHIIFACDSAVKQQWTVI